MLMSLDMVLRIKLDSDTELCLKKVTKANGCGKCIQGGWSCKWAELPGGYCQGPSRERERWGLSWAAAVGAERKRQLCNVFSRLTWWGLAGFDPWKELVISSRRGRPIGGSGFEKKDHALPLFRTCIYLLFIILRVYSDFLPSPLTHELLREGILYCPSI